MNQDPRQQDIPQMNSNNKQTAKGSPNKNPTLQSPPKRKVLLYRGQNSNLNEDQSSPAKNSDLFENVHLKEKLSSSDQREELASSNNSRSSQRQENSNSRHAGSLDKFAEDPKRNSLNRERANLPPTFGEDQFNTAVLQQVLESPPPSKDKFTNVDRMLAEHRRKKAVQQQKFIDLNLPEQHASPFLKKQKTPKSGSKVSFDLNRDFSLTTSDWTADSPLAIRPANGKANISLQKQMNAVSEIYEKSQAFYDDSNPFTDSYRNREEQIPEIPKLPTGQNLSNFATSPQSGQSKTGSPKNAKNVPKISGNSKRIFKNSQRAKEDAQIIENLINANMVKQKRLSQASFEGLQGIPEESEEASNLQSRKISTPQKGFSTPQRNTQNRNVDPRVQSLNTSPQGPSLRTTQGNWATPEKQLSSIQRQKGYDSSKFLSPNDSRSTINPVVQQRSSSPKTPSSPNRSIRRNIQDSFGANTTNISIVYPQKSAPSATIVEHKKKTPLEAIKSSKKKSVSPSREELKEWANMAKSIYLRVVNNEPNILEPSDASPKSFKTQVKRAVKAHPAMEASEFVKKLAEKAKSIDPRKLSPEELKDYDEIQRLEIMLRNLRIIQKADFINAEKNNNTTTFGERSNWEQYAVEINDDATERRSIRRQKTDDKFARLAKSMSPKPMEKLPISVESLFGSALLRQNLVPPPPTNEEGSNSQRSYVQDMGIYERNIMWLNAKHEKLDKLDRDLAEEEVRECSFKPTFFTKSLSLYSPIRNTGNSPISNINPFTDRGTEENEPMEKSLYREKKALETYYDLNDLKKTYNLYKSEIFLPMRIHTSPTSTPVPKMERSNSNQPGSSNLIRPIQTDA